MRVLDLFSGIGGFSLGLERAGMRTVAFCEIDPYCRAVLRKHWPDVPIYEDVRELTAAHVDAVDVICGGFPCQDISVAGKGAGLAGERSGLWREYARLIGEIRPRYVIVENVAALLGRGLDAVLGDLAALGYDAEWHCIPASAVGAPHRRDRIWIIAYPIGEQLRQQPGRSGGACGSGAPQSAEHGGEGDVAHAARDVLAQQAQGGAERQRVGASGEPVFAMGDPDLARLEIGSRLAGHLGAQLQAAVGAGAPVADAESERCGQGAQDGRGRGERDSTWQGAGFASGGWWLAEPDVGRVVDGLSFELDVVRRMTGEQGDRAQAIAATAFSVGLLLRAMWECQEVAASSPELYRRGLRDRVPDMPYGDPQSRWLLGPRIKEDQGLRDLWEAFYAKPLNEAQDMQRAVLERAWKKERPKALGSRIDRLRALGNAVVPQIPEIIGRAIMKAQRC